MVRAAKGKPRARVEFSPLEWEIITMANEDYYILPDVRATVHSLSPGLSEDAVEAEALRILRELIQRGYVYLCRAWPRDNRDEPISRDEALSIISRPDAWEPTEEPVLSFAATKRGEAAWRR